MINIQKAITIIATESFWMMKPFNNSVTDAFEQLKSRGYVEKLKNQITSTSIPSKHEDLVQFLHNQIIHIGMYFNHNLQTYSIIGCNIF